jgi:hypothetical protein
MDKVILSGLRQEKADYFFDYRKNKLAAHNMARNAILFQKTLSPRRAIRDLLL